MTVDTTYSEPTTKVTGTDDPRLGIVRNPNPPTDSTDWKEGIRGLIAQGIIESSSSADQKRSYHISAGASEMPMPIPGINHTYGKGESVWVNCHRTLKGLSRLEDGWDGFSAPAPNRRSIRFAWEVLEQLPSMIFPPNAIIPSAEGGVGISFSQDNRYASFEFCNTGEIVLLKMIGNSDPDVTLVHFSELKSALWNVRDFINPRPPENQWSRARRILRRAGGGTLPRHQAWVLATGS